VRDLTRYLAEQVITFEKCTHTLRSRSHCTVVLTNWFKSPGYRRILISESTS
jgi:hypothetical protein